MLHQWVSIRLLRRIVMRGELQGSRTAKITPKRRGMRVNLLGKSVIILQTLPVALSVGSTSRRLDRLRWLSPAVDDRGKHVDATGSGRRV
jgi:hypothetical protein